MTAVLVSRNAGIATVDEAPDEALSIIGSTNEDLEQVRMLHDDDFKEDTS